MAVKNTPTAPAVKNAVIVESAPDVNASETAATNRAAEAEAKESAGESTRTPEEIATAAGAIADPAPATELTEASGAIVEPAITAAIDVSHQAVDANPRAGTTAVQNAIDFNDAKRANPAEPDFAGQGIDLSVYGDAAKDADPAKG